MSLQSKELKAVWVLENSKKDRNFYMQEIELLYMITSVLQWKKLNPKVPTHLICTPEVYQSFCDLDLVYLWDQIDLDILKESDEIDRKPFWACSKIKAMRKISAPFVMMDNDLFLTRANVMTEEDYKNNGVAVHYKEHGPGYYLLSTDPTLSDLPGLYQPDFDGDSYNVSFLYIRDDDFRQRYADKAYAWMTQLSDGRKEIHGGHMIFCEQKLLYDMVKHERVPVKVIVPDLFDCVKNSFKTSSEMQSYLNHLGPKKRGIRGKEDLLIRLKSDVLFVLKDHSNLKHIFIALKRNDELMVKNDGKFYLSSRLNPYIEPSPLKHRNREGNKICVIYALWEEGKYLSYLKYSLMALITSTDVRERADILVIVSENLYHAAVHCFGGLLSEDSFVIVRGFKTPKYAIPNHPRVQKYDYFMMLDSDAFFMGYRPIFQKIEEFYSDESNMNSIFMHQDRDEGFSEGSSKDVFWSRKKSLCNSIDDEEYEKIFVRRMGTDRFEEWMRAEFWWISCIVIYTKEHFREDRYYSFVMEQLWNNQWCDETVFVSYSYAMGYSIKPINNFFNCYDTWTRKNENLVLYHPIVGCNTTAYSNEEMIVDIETRYEAAVKKETLLEKNI
jgi:hypothetical protein